MSPVFSDHAGKKHDRRPRLAATTVLLREAGEGFEIFFVKRHSKSDFMGGAHVFPGGKVDKSDGDEAWLDRLAGDSARSDAFLARLEPTPGRPLTPPDVLGSIVAAARELFEEAGILLAAPARRPESAAPSPGPEPGALDLHAARAAVHDDASAFVALFEDRGLHLDLEALVYFAHWVTPSLERRRFDARFFLARLPPDQVPRIDEHETVEGVWHTPAAALDAVDEGAMILPPPTLRTVEWLHSFASVDGVFEAARSLEVCAILPKVAHSAQGVAVVLPWHEAYPDLEGEGLPGPSAPFGAPRIVLENRRWRSRA